MLPSSATYEAGRLYRTTARPAPQPRPASLPVAVLRVPLARWQMWPVVPSAAQGIPRRRTHLSSSLEPSWPAGGRSRGAAAGRPRRGGVEEAEPHESRACRGRRHTAAACRLASRAAAPGSRAARQRRRRRAHAARQGRWCAGHRAAVPENGHAARNVDQPFARERTRARALAGRAAAFTKSTAIAAELHSNGIWAG